MGHLPLDAFDGGRTLKWVSPKKRLQGVGKAVGAGVCLKGRRVMGATERFPGTVKAVGGSYWRFEMRLGLPLGYGNAFEVESGPGV